MVWCKRRGSGLGLVPEFSLKLCAFGVSHKAKDAAGGVRSSRYYLLSFPEGLMGQALSFFYAFAMSKSCGSS